MASGCPPSVTKKRGSGGQHRTPDGVKIEDEALTVPGLIGESSEALTVPGLIAGESSELIGESSEALTVPGLIAGESSELIGESSEDRTAKELLIALVKSIQASKTAETYLIDVIENINGEVSTPGTSSAAHPEMMAAPVTSAVGEAETQEVGDGRLGDTLKQ